MAANINKQLDDLFEEWRNSWESTIGKRPFTPDGLMRKYHTDFATTTDEEKRKTLRDKLDEEIQDLWLKSNRRVVFLLKDQNQPGYHADEDMRIWFEGERMREVRGRFVKKLAAVLYGLTQFDSERGIVPFGDLTQEMLVQCFNKEPFALVEGKKEPGKSSVSDGILCGFLNRDKDFIRREFEILKPNIFVCSGRALFDFVCSLYEAKPVEGTNGELCFVPGENKVIIHTHHPSFRFCSCKNHYTNCMNLFSMFMQTADGKAFGK